MNYNVKKRTSRVGKYIHGPIAFMLKLNTYLVLGYDTRRKNPEIVKEIKKLFPKIKLKYIGLPNLKGDVLIKEDGSVEEISPEDLVKIIKKYSQSREDQE